jgi:hypothetical protein
MQSKTALRSAARSGLIGLVLIRSAPDKVEVEEAPLNIWQKCERAGNRDPASEEKILLAKS